jgi:hypothetical protein
MSFSVEGNRSERRNFGNIDSAVEYITHRPHENFTVYDATADIVKEIRQRLENVMPHVIIRQG